jgi:catechol 2,3-dioxygenase-like lactoylglutathione lyase family enzyme
MNHVHGDRERPLPDGRVDHLWLRVRDTQASRRFYTTIAPHADLRLGDDDPGRVQFRGEDYTFSLIDDERPLTEHVHLVFPADEDQASAAARSAPAAFLHPWNAGTDRFAAREHSLHDHGRRCRPPTARCSCCSRSMRAGARRFRR